MADILDYIDKMQVMYGDKEPSSMDQEPRNMYAQGQLVQPNIDGSRPGYQGNPLKKYLINNNGRRLGVEKMGTVPEPSSKIIHSVYRDKKTGKEINVYKVKITDKPLQIDGKMKAGKGGDYKTLLSGPDKTEFSTLKEAETARDNFYKENPLKRPKGNESENKKKARKIRKNRLKITDPSGAKGTEKFPFHHIRQIGGDVPLTTDDVAIIKQRMNSVMSQYNEPLNRIADSISKNNKLALEAMNSKNENAALKYMKRVSELNDEAESLVKSAIKKLPNEYKNLIGFNRFSLPTNEYGLPIGNEPLVVKKVGGATITKDAIPLTDLTREQDKALRTQIKADAKAGKTGFIDKKKIQVIKNLVGELACGTGKKLASGGRINFSNGSSCNVRGKKILERIVSTGKGTKAELSAAQKILNFGKGAFSLKGLVGPQALLFEAAIAAGSVGYDVAAGKPLKEAIGNNLNLILGPKWKQDVEAMEFDRLKGSGVDIDQLKQLATAYKQSDAMSKLYNRQYSLEQNKDNLDLESFEGVDMQSREKELKQLNMTINELEKPSGFNVIENITKTTADPKILRNQDMATDILKTQEANRSILPDFTTAPIFDTRYTNKKMGEMKELSPSYSDQDIDKILTGYGRDPKEFNYKYTPINFPGDTSSKPVTGRDDVRDFFKIEEQNQKIADAGGVANMASGGIMNLRKKYYD